tara:strand:- start:1638 stop:2852 length:1215 start_codon:yes stop_codon:yes gene_type:complete
MLLRNDAVCYTDLVNNFEQFHIQYKESDLLDFQGKWGDDSDYSHIQTIEDLLENLTPKDLEKSHIVSVDIRDIFSSEESLGGCDRPLWSIQQNTAQKQQFKSLNRHMKYRQDAAQVLSGMMRPHPDGGWILVKYIGNNRVLMKLLANAGVSTRVLMSIRFHEPSGSQSEYIAIESELHATDAGDKSGQNEAQKFTSGYRANRENEVYCFNFLKNNQFNYRTIMTQENVEGCEDWLTLKSLQGIKDGRGNGHFKKYGENNIIHALNTIKELAKITGEKVIGATPVEVIALMYSIYTVYGKKEAENPTPMFTPKQLHDYFVKLWKIKQIQSFGQKSELKINSLSWSGGVKDNAYICAREFWPTIVEYWMDINSAKIGWSIECHANTILVSKCMDKHLAREVRAAIA